MPLLFPLVLTGFGLGALSLIANQQTRNKAASSAQSARRAADAAERRARAHDAAAKKAREHAAAQRKRAEHAERAKHKPAHKPAAHKPAAKHGAGIHEHTVRPKHGAKPHAKPPAPPPPHKPVTHEHKPAAKKRGAKAAAEALYSYVTERIRAGHAAELGDKGHPNATVKAAQADMGKLTADGIYGPKTRARGKEILGREFPARTAARVPAPPPKVAPKLPPPPPIVTAPASSSPRQELPTAEAPPARSPVEAANALYTFAKSMIEQHRGAELGTKARPSETVRNAQTDMGELTADGIYGPNTRARGKALTGRTFPVRVAGEEG